METLKKYKKELRNTILSQRRSLSSKEKQALDNQLFKTVISVLKKPEWTAGFRQGCFLYTYVSMQDEADTKKLLAWCWENGIKTAVPKVTGSVMEFYEIISMNCLEPGFMGILEPNSTCPLIPRNESLGFMIVPGTAFGRDGSRIGYGGGFYDKYLEGQTKLFTAGCCYGFQLFSSVPHSSLDVKMDLIITEKEVLEHGIT